ncbi:MAG: tetratricopeptide repeat protein [Polyangiaceae bacterium]
MTAGAPSSQESQGQLPPQLPLHNPRLHAAGTRVWQVLVDLWLYFSGYFTKKKPTFMVALWPALLLTTALYSRWISTNYIFDEQEALLGNPYVNQQGFKYEEAIYRDFWGLPANASIGSYRPIPNYVWRGLVEVGERGQRIVDERVPVSWQTKIQKRFFEPEPLPKLSEVARRSWFQHLFNLFFHAVNGALFTAMGWRVTGRRLPAWFAGATFITAAILTEAVSGVVGLADILGGMGALLALAALGLRGHAMPFGVFLGLTIGLFSKESAIVCIPLVPVAAVLLAPVIHPERPARFARGGLAAIGTLAAFVLYVEMRKRWFPSPLPSELKDPIEPGSSRMSYAVRDFMIWFHQAPLPKDPLNNPLVDAQLDERIAGACRVYFRGLVQVVFPWHLSGDYSAPQEPIPAKIIFPESVLGWGATVLPLGFALGIWLVSLKREAQRAKLAGFFAAGRPAKAVVDSEPEVEAPRNPGRIGRLLRALSNEVKDTRVGKWTLANQRVLAEAAILIFSIILVRKMLSIGPYEGNRDMGDKDPQYNIILPPNQLADALAYGACACVALGALVESAWRPRKTPAAPWRIPIVALGLVWLVVSYFPHSNMYVLLPTVRAERLWYFPVLGTTMVVATALTYAVDRVRTIRGWAGYAWIIPTAFLGFQAGRAYWHATDYRDDLIFWRETKDAVPHSAKAHLNYSVMAGARGMMEIRLQESHIARQLAPDWAMAHVYTGDTLCRMGFPEAAIPHYKRGFVLGPNDQGLIKLALQCMWDYQVLLPHEHELRALAEDHPGSWFAYLLDDTIRNGAKQGGVQHKPRGYDEPAADE